MSVRLRPLGDHLIVEPVEERKMTASGIVLPETAREKPLEGKVLAVGPGCQSRGGERIPMDIEEGDRILFAKYAGTEVKLGSSRILILKGNGVLAVVNDELGGK